MTIEGQTGSNKEALAKYIPLIEEVVSSYEELKVYYVTLTWNSITVYIELIDSAIRQDAWQRDVFEIEKAMLDGLDSLRSQWLLVEVATIENGPPAGSPVGVKLNAANSKDIATLKEVADDFKEFLQTIPWTKNVSTSSTENPGQFVFEFNREKLSFIGLSPDDILWELRFYIAGIGAWSIQSLYEDNDIVLSVAEFQDELNPKNINDLIVNTKVWKVRVWDYSSFSFEP